MHPLISICIPAYKNVVFLERLLISISIQTFTNFEVVITDDSNDSSVADYIKNKTWPFTLIYFKNETALGSPENWNEAVGQAKGEWIKIMHDDDWFNSAEGLGIFAGHIQTNTGSNFFFCSYLNVHENGKSETKNPPANFTKNLILKDPVALLANNIIGPPSVTIYKNNNQITYDKRLKWLVDMDFYIRYLKTTNVCYIPQMLVNIGIHDEQVTQSSFRKREIEIPEHLIILEKTGNSCFKNIIVYDAFGDLSEI